jgi:hypothetical protein
MGSSLADRLLDGNTRFNMDLVASYIGDDQEKFDELIELMLNAGKPLKQRAAWAMSIITDKKPRLLMPHETRLIEAFDNFGHTALHRSVLRYFASVEISEKKMGRLLDLCYKYLLDNKMPPAVKVHAMQIIYNISEKEPDLKEELKLTLESIIDEGVPAIKSRGGQILKKL